MKKNLLISFGVLFLIVIAITILKNKPTPIENEKQLTAREKYSLFLKNHPFNNHKKEERSLKNEGEEEEEGKQKNTDRPDLAWEQDYLRTLDPALGRPAPERLPAIIAKMRNFALGKTAPGNISAPWVERGPNNIGGRTRALIYDPNDLAQKKVWAGGVNGGLWYNNDITNVDSSWRSVNDFWDNIAISCIAFDPNNSLIAYVGTGEGFGSSASRGAGIWKTTNGGSTWNQISSTNAFYYVNDIVVRNESSTSVVYAAVDGGYYNGIWHGAASAGLQRSINGGTNWAQVLPNVPSTSNVFVAADIEISANNRIWIGTKANPFSSTDRGGGRILTSLNGTTWTTSNTTTVNNGDGRVELACAPSDSNYVYAVIENNSAVSVLKKTVNSGSAWSNITKPIDADTDIPSTDFSRGQAWYDLIMAVDPNNSNTLIVGAIDLFRSTNGGSSWSQISKWSNNNNLSSLNCSVVHADQHAIVYKPGSSSTVIFGNDGGIFYTSSVSTSATNNVIPVRNKNYNVTQFYACAIHPTSGSNVFLAGAQDNGSQRFTTAGINATTEVNGGDGAFCFIDQVSPSYQITSYVYNTYDLSTNGGVSFPTNLSSDQNTGRFINPSDYDNNKHILYSCRGNGTLNRIKNITTTPTSVQTVTITGMTDYASHISVSPYTTSTTTLFVGTESGSLFKVTNADNTPTVSNITGSSFPTGSISCVEIGASENELLVTFFNYGVNSVWYTANGGSSWVSKEGNLPDMPIRWALFNPLNRSEVILATELGVWASVNFTNTTPTWAASNSGLANVRVDMLQIRSSDNQVIAATHGRGLFSSNGFSLNCIVPTTQASNISFSNVFSTQMNVSWTNGNGSRRIVYINNTNSFTAPSNSTDPVANSVYSGSGQQVIYNGTNNSASVTGLTASTTYYFRVYEANCNGTNSFYQTSTASNNPIAQATSTTLIPTQRINETFSSVLTPAGWTLTNSNSLLSRVTTVNAYNSTANVGCVKADNFNISTGAVGILETRSFYPTITGDSLKFDVAAAGYGSPYFDSLSIFSFNGTTYTRIRGWLTTSGADTGITSLGSTSEYLTTASNDWKTKRIALPVGTSKIQFRWKSGYGNSIFVDNIVVDSFISLPPLNGAYTVGSSGSYSTITAALTDLYIRGVSGPVTFNLTQTLYNSSSETFPLTIYPVVGASASNTITIKPASATNVTIDGNSTNGVFNLMGADFIRINGSNNGTTSRNLTIRNTTNGVNIWLSSLGVGAGATNNIITNTNITGNSFTTDVNGIVISGNTTTANGADNDNNTISFNRFNKLNTGIYVRGTATNTNDSLRILNNFIGSDTAANIVDFKGIDIARINASSINANTIYGMVSATTQKAAIELNGEITNTAITNNTIKKVEYVGTGGWATRGISATVGAGNNNVTIANNMITGVLSDAWGTTAFTYHCIGILLNGGTNYNIHFNTINMTGQRDNSANNNIGTCIWVESALTSSISLRNNILTNSQTSINTSAGFNYCVYVNGTVNPFSTINHNLYNCKTATPLVVTPFTGRINSANLSTLANWRTTTSGDLNSTNDSAFFVSTIDAHLTGTSIGNFNLKGSPITGLTTDIDGQTRNGSFPYMGADEIITAPLPVKLTLFTAKNVAGNVQLNWVTASEFNNKGFDIMRSMDGVNFKTIGFVKGAGNSSTILNYSETDLNAFENNKVQKLYYRLNQIDFDGQTALSDIREVSINDNNWGNIKVYPNPFNTVINLDINANVRTENTITVTDVSGKTVSKTTVVFEKGLTNYTINNLEKLPSGTYFVKIENSITNEVIKVVKN
jgi:hypothetical protein